MDGATDQAMRANTGKPKLSYLLSFKGGISFALSNSSLDRISDWYRGEEESISLAVHDALQFLDPDWPTYLAQVSEFGVIKYARGNYLKGRPWSDTCDSLVRHCVAKSRGEATDPDSGLPHDGHIAWNLLFLQHCVLVMPHFDDRLRAPVEITKDTPGALLHFDNKACQCLVCRRSVPIDP